MKPSVIIPLLIPAAICILSSCSCREQHAAVPKPEAWPRIELPAQTYRTIAAGQTKLCLNVDTKSDIKAKDDSVLWVTIRYPQFKNAIIYLTLTETSPSAIDRILANRRERMALNSGGATTEIIELTSAGQWQCELAETRSSLTTPVQLLASDGGHVLSGALYLDLPPASSADSVAPIVRAVKDDMLMLLKNLRNQP